MHLPIGLLEAYVEKLPVLQAEAELRQLQVHTAASGNMRKPDFTKYLSGLQRAARGGR